MLIRYGCTGCLSKPVIRKAPFEPEGAPFKCFEANRAEVS